MILGGAADLLVAGEAGDGGEVPAAVAACVPHVVVLTTFDADEYVLRALRAGASGFLLKDTPPMEIVTAVRRVHAGEPILSPAVIRRLITHVAGQPPAPADVRPGPGADQVRRRDRARRVLDGLSPRERDVAVAVGQGRSSAEIAAELFMSVATVKAYVSRLLSRLELNNRVQIAVLVHDADLT
ncbi:LuxR C-terminal-related transcriptional regulator [Micromonospora sp. LOL_015]|uniref:LuxR C-terminal-related transcriptional regulator n=1 Tax=Micromonospora sp. LOL_015 TaxID=3345416 RepID=UPI003A844A62